MFSFHVSLRCLSQLIGVGGGGTEVISCLSSWNVRLSEPPTPAPRGSMLVESLIEMLEMTVGEITLKTPKKKKDQEQRTGGL